MWRGGGRERERDRERARERASERASEREREQSYQSTSSEMKFAANPLMFNNPRVLAK